MNAKRRLFLCVLITIYYGAPAGATSADTPARRTLRAILDVAAAAAADSLDPDASADASAAVALVQQLPDSSQQLRICNAFAHSTTLAVNLARTHKDLASLAYKECTDLELPLKEGDRLDFHADGLGVGSFAMRKLPATPRMLLLVVHRRHRHSLAAAFKSHAFAADSSGLAQVAIIDTFRANKTAHADDEQDKVRILSLGHGNNSKAEELPLNAVVAVSPGFYQVALDRPGMVPSKALLTARPQVSYVVMRVGDPDTADLHRRTFPPELVVFPQIMNGAAARPSSPLLGSLLAAALLAALLGVPGLSDC